MQHALGNQYSSTFGFSVFSKIYLHPFYLFLCVSGRGSCLASSFWSLDCGILPFPNKLILSPPPCDRRTSSRLVWYLACHSVYDEPLITNGLWGSLPPSRDAFGLAASVRARDKPGTGYERRLNEKAHGCHLRDWSGTALFRPFLDWVTFNQ